MNKFPISFSEPYLDEKVSIKYLKDVLQSKWLTSGKYVKRLEQNTNSYLRSKYAIALSNCTTALHISLLVNGIKEGDEVIVPSFTWISSVNSIFELILLLLFGRISVLTKLFSNTFRYVSFVTFCKEIFKSLLLKSFIFKFE